MKERRKKSSETIRKISCTALVVLMIFQSSFLLECVKGNSREEGDELLRYTIFFDQPLLDQIQLNNTTFTTIEMSKCLSHASPGEPALPVRPVKILLPYGEQIDEINVSYQQSTKIESALTQNPILPQQLPILVGETKRNQSVLINTSIYESTDPVFEKVFSVGEIGFCRGFSLITVYLYPIQYIPKTKTVYYFPEMDITISLTENRNLFAEKQKRYLRLNKQDITTIKSTVINPQIIDTYVSSPSILGMFDSESGLCNPDDTYEYVIITNEALNNTSTHLYNWSDLLNHRREYSGLNATKITVETIDACPAYWNETTIFNDTQAHIREFIIDAYQNWETQYVVLGGDDDVVPARIFVEYNSLLHGDPYYDMPCDMYYSHLTGDWRDTVHNCWGGGRNSGVNDHYAEVNVGRMTVDSAEQLSNFIKKILWYDSSADNEFVNNTAFFGGNLGVQFSVTSAEYMEEIRNGDDPNFYQCSGFTEWNTAHPDEFFNISTRIYYDWGNSIPSDYQTAINSDTICLINHLGHSTPTSAFGMTNAQLSGLSNSKYFFSYSQQCLSGRFTEGDTAEKTVTCMNADNGAFGLVWNTGYGWGSNSNTNGPNQFLQRHFWHYFFNSNTDSWQLGKAQTFSKDELSDYIDIAEWYYSWCYNWYSSHLFGDPAQRLKTTVADPELCMITDESPQNQATSVPLGNTSLEVTVSDPQGDLMNVTFRTNASGAWQDIGINSSQYNGTYTQIYNCSTLNTTFWWSVNLSDIAGNSGWTNETYHFTTRPIHTVSAPESFYASSYNKTQINLSWIKGENATHTVLERNTQSCWQRGEGTMIYNGTNDSYSDTGRNFGEMYYYQAWGWDSVDKIWSSTNATNNTCTINTIPEVFDESPENGSVNTTLQPTVCISVSDRDSDLMNVTFWTNATGSWTRIGYNQSSSDGSYEQMHSFCNDYSTQYWWSVNCTDGEGWKNNTYQFTTRANQAPTVSAQSPANGSIDVSQSLSSVSITITDPENDTLNWTIETSPDIGNMSAINDTSGMKSCSISGLEYGNTYYWYVNITDNGSGMQIQKTYWFTIEEQSVPYSGSRSPSTPNPTANNPPNVTEIPNGTTLGYPSIDYLYSTQSIDPDNDQIQYRFDWGDGTLSDWSELVDSGSSVCFTHNWSVSGTYQIRSQVKDEEGEESIWSESLEIVIQNQSIDTESFDIVCKVPENMTIYEQVQFNCSIRNYSEDTSIIYSWDFGDGQTGIGSSPNHQYLVSGRYTVTLTISNSTGEVLNVTSFEVVVSAEGNSHFFSSIEKNQSHDSSLYVLLFIGIIGSILVILFFLQKKKRKKIF